MQPRLIAENLHKGFQVGSGGRLDVLQGASLTVNAGEVVAIIGDSGAGKTTLLHLLGALDRPDQGTVSYDGQDIFQLNDHRLSRWRNHSVGFIFQFHHLLPEFSALENVAMPALIGGEPLHKARHRATSLLEQLGLQSRLDHRPSQLSGGEQQRIAVARALMNQPALILADEPTGSLDTKTAGVLHEELLNLSRMHNQAFVIATHNPALSELCDRILVLHDGRLQEK